MDDPLWRNVSTGQNARSAPHGSAAAPRTSDGRIGTVPHPVLVVAGTDDPLTSVVNGMIMTHLLPQGRLLVAHGEGHLMLLDSRSAALTPLHEFFEADELADSQVRQQATTVDAEQLDTALAGQEGADAARSPGGLLARISTQLVGRNRG